MTETFARGSCHCGAVSFEVTADLGTGYRCNCSYCRRKGILMTEAFPETALRIVSGRERLRRYQFGSQMAEHFYCDCCAIHLLNRTRKDPTRWRANMGCLAAVDPFGVPVVLIDGASTPSGAVESAS